MEKPRFDIFLGGPMGDKGDDGAGTPFALHFERLTEAVEAIRDELNGEDNQPFVVTVDSPVVNEFGAIPDTIFNMLNFAELGIMDLSANSPSVMYELTFLHTLGTPVLPIVLKSQHRENLVPFYLSQDYIAVVDDFNVETLKTKLRPLIKASLGPMIMGADRSRNPITKFYEMPMIEASATTGLATGYFHNFLSNVIAQTNSVFQKMPKLKKCVVLRPSSIEDVAPMKQEFTNRLKEIGVEVENVGEGDGQVYEDPKSVRGQMLLFKAGSYIIDTPTPLNAQKSSPRFTRIRKLLLSADGPQREEVRGLIAKLEGSMIEQFFRRLEYLSVETPNVTPNRLMFATPDEMIKILRKEKEEGEE